MSLRRRIALFIAATALLAACAGVPKLAPPSVAVSSVTVNRASAGFAGFAVVLSLANPNDRDIAVDAIDAALTIEGVPIGSAVLAAPVRLPARGEAGATLDTRASLDAMARVAAQIALQADERRADPAGPVVRYTISGVATLEGGLAIPFSHSGEIQLRGRRSGPQ